ncbi:MAG: hypothetical protein ABEH90_06470 [Halolamina sp.]
MSSNTTQQPRIQEDAAQQLQVTPGEIESVTLPPAVKELTDQYTARMGERDDYLWKWTYSATLITQLPSAYGSYTPELRKAKTLLVLYITILDDLAEQYGDKETFDECRKIPFPHTSPTLPDDDIDADRIEYARETWDAIVDQLEAAPRYEEYVDLFRYDLRQAINAMHYTWLTNENPGVVNMTGTKNYDTHNMCIFLLADIDLMHSPGFDRLDLSTLRETLWETQYLARIGNWVTTWEREVHEGDYSSAVVAKAIVDGVVTLDELESDDVSDETVVSKIKDAGIEERISGEWESRYRGLLEREYDTRSIDIRAYVKSMKTLFEFHRASRGKK